MLIVAIKKHFGFNFWSGVFAILIISGCGESSSSNNQEKTPEVSVQPTAPAIAAPQTPESFAKGEAVSDTAVHFDISDPRTLGVHVTDNAVPPGMKIIEVAQNSQAEKFGLLPNDVIIKVNDSVINSAREFEAIYKSFQSKISIEMALLRNGHIQNVDVITP